MKVIEYKPPQGILNLPYATKSVFLAGTIDNGDSNNWQNSIVETLKSFGGEEIIVFNPRRDDWNSSWEQSIHYPEFYRQVQWEMDCMERADIIYMNFEENSKSPITLLEFGLYAKSNKLIVNCHDNFWRKGNIEMVCEKYNIHLYNNFEESINQLYYRL